MATLALTDWSISNIESGLVVANQANPKLKKLAFGDKYEGLFTYTVTGTSINSNFTVRFNPGLFVNNGFDDAANLANNETYVLQSGILTNDWRPLNFTAVGSQANYVTGRNETYEIKRLTSTTFQIKMTFWMTADIKGYLGSVGGGQYSRLTSDVLSNSPSIYNNSNTTIYNPNLTLDVSTLGLYCSIIYTQSPTPKVVFSSPATPTSGFTITASVGSGIDFTADGWTNPCGTGATQVELTIYTDGTANSPITFQGTLNPGATAATQLVFTSAVNFPIAYGGGSYVVELTAIECGDTYVYGDLGATNARVRQWDYLDIDGLFVDEGIHTNRSFSLTRGGNSVVSINTTNNTDLDFDFTYTGSEVTKAKYWFIPVNMGNPSNTWWFDALQRTPIQFTATPTPVNISGNQWRISQTFNPGLLNLQDGEYYHILYVLYDEIDNYYASYVLQNVEVSSRIEVPSDGTYAPVPMTGKLYTYKDEFDTDYLQVSPLQRVAAKLIINKAAYNVTTNYNRVQNITATLELPNGAILNSGSANVVGGVTTSSSPSIRVLTDNAAEASLVFLFRIEDEYTQLELTVRWLVESLTEPTETILIQKFRVDDYQQNLILADQKLTEIQFIDELGVLLSEDDRNCEGGDIIVRTIKTIDSPNYAQVGVWLDNNRFVTEADFFNGPHSFIPPLANTLQINGEEQFSTNSPNTEVNHTITSTVNEGEVGIVGYPPPLPNNFARIMLHHTNPNGRNIVFVAQENINPGTKVFSALDGITTTADYTFRIGSNAAALVDANAAGWGVFSSVSWAVFAGSTIPAGSRVRVEYNGPLTQTDIPSYIDYLSENTPVYPRVMGKKFPVQLAANDIMLYTGTDTTFNSIATGAALRYTARRNVATIVNSDFLVDYTPGETEWNIFPNGTTGNHVFIQPTAVGSTTNTSITVSTITPGLQLSTYATPLTNRYYPASGTGVNINALKGDAINDQLYVPAGATGADLLYPELMTVGEERSYTFLGMQCAFGFYDSTVNSFFRDLGNSNILYMWFQSGRTLQFFETAEPLAFGNSLVRYFTITIRRIALTGLVQNCFEIEVFRNGKKLAILSQTGNITNATAPHQGTRRYNLGLLNALTNIPLSNSFRNQGIRYFAMHKRILSKKEIREIHLGNDIANYNPNYHYDFTNLVVDGSKRRIPNLGTDAIDDARLENHTNLLTPLFP